ncbi:unnamed protein product [Phytophthora lilii]|uniref:Unnamed protein product n=1 Tax=Phytophthora lilii TaxID=2077276 RepID=A0A9W6TC66_9STRA|nr:unnamed protein product [Phytophthora lilii]
MGLTGITTANSSIKHLHNVLTHIQNLSAKASEEGNANKHQHIRVTHWVRKLRSQPTSNPTWLKSVLEYANVLLQMLREGVRGQVCVVLHLHSTAKLQLLSDGRGALHENATTRSVGSSSTISGESRARATQRYPARSRPHLIAPHNNNFNDNVQTVAVVRKASKQIQTQEQDDQWEWQRVWKGAFDKMRQQLQQKTEETDALVTENNVRSYDLCINDSVPAN